MISTLKPHIDDFHVSSNASRGIIRVRYPRLCTRSGLEVDLLDANGVVMEVPIRVIKHEDDVVDIVISNTIPGIYLLKIYDGKTCIIKRIILQ
ncbi:MAG: hypothetical protein DRI69_05705 [Bacteroidetes bacterium]|nr:MAG: hypothetical protein DRI69_05705 [Bacteroidota bacterium]